jgi:hypothetical protein
MPKVEVMQRTIAAIRPDVEMTALCSPVEHVPRGLLSVDLILACVDSKQARMAINEIAWRLNIPWVDAGVHGDGLLARVSVFVPAADQPCLECAWGDLEYAALDQHHPCAAPNTQAPPSNAPACLGSLAASLQVIICSLLLGGGRAKPMAGRQLVLDPVGRHLYDTALRRNPNCRFDHKTWRVQYLRRSPEQLTLGEALKLCNGAHAAPRAATLRLEPSWFVRRLACPCGAQRDVLKVYSRISGKALACPRCGREMQPTNIGATSSLSAADLSARELKLSLSRLGFRGGDIIGISHGHEEAHYELAMR